VPGVFVVKGWSREAGTVIEIVVVAWDEKEAKARVEADGLTLVVVRPYAPAPPDPGSIHPDAPASEEPAQ
jgi:hypothetical protein